VFAWVSVWKMIKVVGLRVDSLLEPNVTTYCVVGAVNGVAFVAVPVLQPAVQALSRRLLDTIKKFKLASEIIIYVIK